MHVASRDEPSLAAVMVHPAPPPHYHPFELLWSGLPGVVVTEVGGPLDLEYFWLINQIQQRGALVRE